MSTALPSAFVQRIREDKFINNVLLEALNDSAPISLRLHSRKGNLFNQPTEEVPWCPHGRYLQERPVFTLDPLFHAGAYSPQEASSMALWSVLTQLQLPEAPIVLDLSAAPGGKSTLIADFLNGKGTLLSNEIIPNRAYILKENMIKWGYSNTHVTNNTPEAFGALGPTVDVVLVDAPCSGEGMFRKDHASRSEWTVENALHCARRQEEILTTTWDVLKAGGFLIYSTCTFNPEENEQQIERLLQTHDAELIDVHIEGFTKGRNSIGWYAFPNCTKGEGFYIAVIQKKGIHHHLTLKKNKQKSALTSVGKDAVPSLFKEKEGIYFTLSNSLFHISDSEQFERLQHLFSRLKFIKIACELGELHPKHFIPHHALAMNCEAIYTPERIRLNLQEALAYLKGETFPLHGDIGFCVVTYEKTPLGWIKHLGKRFNNLYPKEWRIRMNIPPELSIKQV